MTTAAWVMMLLSWTVITFVTARFFLMVLKHSGESMSGDKGEGGAT